MLKHCRYYLLIALLSCASAMAQDTYSGATERADGTVQGGGASMQVWHKDSWQWMNVENFWSLKMRAHSGRVLDTVSTLPTGEDVTDNDLLLLSGEQGNCLMIFTSNQWQQATDVFDWDPKLKTYPGCANLP